MTGCIKTSCPYCGVGCGVAVTTTGDGEVAISGDPDHPANFGRLCSKGSALGETIGLEGRLLTPQVNGKPASWDASLGLVANRFQEAIREHGPDSVAFYVSGQLLTEDYYVANKLMKGYIGSGNIDTNSRLCMASSVAGHKRAFGTDTVPGTYEDLEEADLVVLVGSNLAWCHPVLYQRIVAAVEKRPQMRIFVVDPRRTATCEIADMHLAIKPGTDVALFNGLLSTIAAQGAWNSEFAENVAGLDKAIASAEMDDPTVTGLSQSDLEQFYNAWCSTEKVVTVYSQGVNQAANGTDRVNSIINCHLATGRIGRLGMGPLSVTGQPNAMGGREVGGLANMLACHLDIENPDHRTAVQDFWQSPAVPETQGLKAVDMFEAVRSGQIKAIWIMSTNPVDSMPEANRVREALEICPFVVVSDILSDTDTNAFADVLLPAAAWGEKSGTVTNSDRTISRQRSFLDAPGDVLPDWKIICEVAARMGWEDDFNYGDPSEIFREHAALSKVAAELGKDFDISAAASVSSDEYKDWKPTRWPINDNPKERFFADGRFFTPDGKARAIAVRHHDKAQELTDDFPFRLLTGRVRDHWHTMTRTGRSGRLGSHIGEPFVELHPSDASRLGIKPAELARVTTLSGKITARVQVTDRVPESSIFVPIHWTDQFASDARIDATVAALCDPFSGQPALKSSAAQLSRVEAKWYGFAMSLHPLQPATDYWSLSKRPSGYAAELAGETTLDFETLGAQLFPSNAVFDQKIEVRGRQSQQTLFFRDGLITAGLYVSDQPVAVSRSFVMARLGQPVDAAALAGRPAIDQPDPGACVCSCFDVGSNTILAAIEEHGLRDLHAIGEKLRAGTNCGSCRPELRALLASTSVKVAAQ